MPRYVVSSESPITVRALARPGHGLPWPERPVDPGYGVEGPEVEPPEEPPPGVWPGPSPEHPIVPVPPGDETPPGTIWPSPGTPEHPIHSQKLWLIAYVPGYGYKYICVDPSLMPRPTPHA